MSIQPCIEPECREREGVVELFVEPRAKDLGGFSVRRVLPAEERQLVGPFIFFDHMGPAEFEPGRGIDVRPHPHIGLATLTYLFEGEILHRDSLGNVQPIRPGAVNWMTAGRGIVHSERTPKEARVAKSRAHGIQSWVALPRAAEEAEPCFAHHAADSLPVVEAPGIRMTLIAGAAYGNRSPVETASDMFYLDVALETGATLTLPGEYEDRAAYVVDGEIRMAGEAIGAYMMVIARAGAQALLEATCPTRLMLLGGAPLDGARHIWWNLVSSSRDRIEQAKLDWKEGRFGRVPGEVEFIPLPEG